ncbi:hypothetical protein [Phytohabitans houttuyneae]|uniref:Uncharacterized protein n=1 Tax=Phytohabitans houttuyneae TaxID=1076126 RepID=A0A6V8KC43_9ACTN|nr:hypothetical protein [Phytohabitans houttuyneae]GFJ78315.1 hypothetical protein Phou_024950 [Phytohabitans houttuyneae]
MTEVNEPNQHDNGHDGNEDQAVVPVPPSVAVLLMCTADVIMQGLPEPVRVDVTRGAKLDVEVSSHTDLSAWSQVLGLRRWPWSSQSYVSGGTLCQLTNVYGQWRNAPVRVHCLEPVDAITALHGGDEPGPEQP